MKLLRDNLIFLPAAEDGGICYLEDPETSKKYEFDEQEYFLVNAIRNSYHAVVLLAKYNAQFGSDMDLDQLKAFISRLEDWGLLNGKDRPTAPVVPESRNDGVKTESETESKTVPEIDDTSPPERLDRAQIKENFPGLIYLFCPERLTSFLVYWFGFTRYLVKLLPVLVVVAFIDVFFNVQNFFADHAFSRLDFNLFQHLVFTMFTMNLGNVLLKGSMARYFRVPIPAFGIKLALGLIPRFALPVKIPQDAPKRVKLWLSSSSIVIRVVLFCVGVFVWQITRDSGNQLPLYALSLAFVALISNIFVSNPLMESDGYRLLTIYFDKPDLRERAYRALKFSTSKQPEVIAQYVDTSNSLKIYALACLLFIVLILAIVGWVVANWLESNYRGLGVAVFLLLVIYQLRRYWVSKAAKQKRPGGKAQEPMAGSKAEGFIERDGDIVEMRESGSKARRSPSGLRTKVAEYGLVRISVILVIGACMFLPYPYESGGEAVISPYVFQKLYPETPGVIESVYFEGGEFLERGTVIAEMANYRQLRDVEITQQEILKSKEELEILLSTPSPEQVMVAREKLATAALQLEFSITEEARLAALVDEAYVSETEHQKAVEEVQVSHQKVQEQEAALTALKAQVNPNAIDALKLDIKVHQRNLEYYQELLERTRLRMPFDGSIITMSLRNLENTYLDEGDLFAEVEDSSQVKVDIMIPEADADEIALGNRVRLKLEAFPDKAIVGEVTTIAPATEDSQFGAVLTVTSIIDNESRLLKSGMTGHAKVEGREMFLVVAFTRSFLRFVQVEMWSWLP
jgi:putative peptide zinc metalloprotease protein